MLYRKIIAVCFEIHTNTLCGQNVELLNVKLVVHIVTTGLLNGFFSLNLNVNQINHLLLESRFTQSCLLNTRTFAVYSFFVRTELFVHRVPRSIASETLSKPYKQNIVSIL